MLVCGLGRGPSMEEVRAAMVALAPGEPLVWWAAGVPLGHDATPAIVTDHVRLLAPPMPPGTDFTALDDCYDFQRAVAWTAETGLTWRETVVADVLRPEALSAAERRALLLMGAGWAVSGATAATLVARARQVCVIGLVSDAETRREFLEREGKGGC